MSADEGHDMEEGQELSIDMFRGEDPEGVSRPFRAVYSGGYAVKLVYSPATLIEAFDKRENVPAYRSGGIISEMNSFLRGAASRLDMDAMVGERVAAMFMFMCAILQQKNRNVC